MIERHEKQQEIPAYKDHHILKAKPEVVDDFNSSPMLWIDIDLRIARFKRPLTIEIQIKEFP